MNRMNEINAWNDKARERPPVIYRWEKKHRAAACFKSKLRARKGDKRAREIEQSESSSSRSSSTAQVCSVVYVSAFEMWWHFYFFFFLNTCSHTTISLWCRVYVEHFLRSLTHRLTHNSGEHSCCCCCHRCWWRTQRK